MPKFVPRQRKHKVRRRLEQDGGKVGVPTGNDSNAAEILSSTFTEKEKKKQNMKNALRAQQPKISSKKQKRLDKYVDKKLRKEENLDLIKKLANAKVDTSLLRSSRSLGGKPAKREVLSQALKESEAGVNVEKNREMLFEDRNNENDNSEDSGDAEAAPTQFSTFEAAAKPAFGSGLKRPLETDVDGNRVIKRRRRLKKVKHPSTIATTDLSWEGFSSENEPDASSRSLPSPTASIGTQTDSQDENSEDSDALPRTSDSEDYTDESENDDYDPEERKERSSAFKAWATSQVNEALGFKPTADSHTTLQNGPPAEQPTHTPRELEQDPLPPELEVTSSTPERRAFSVKIERPPDVQEARLGLPVIGEEQKIMEAIYNNPTVVIWGATGSGKTTQVPQFLYEAGFGSPDSPNPGMIGVTQPRRVAAVSMAKRVGDELGGVGEKVSYQIRFDSSVSSKTAIKFMTDGILIREIANDFALLKYSVIIIDEAHERSANTDILIGMVSRIVDLRATMSKEDKKIKPLKLVIMSATLRITDFLENPNLFRNGTPPLVRTEGRQYFVTTHFARRTQRDYLEEAFEKVCKGHKKLPPGGMLVFLTGQNEIIALAKRLDEALANSQGAQSKGHKVRFLASEAPLETEDLELGDDAPGFDDFQDDEESDGDPFDTKDDQDFEVEDSTPASSMVHILPLYSQLQTKDQLRVFEPPPENARMIVLATNVAETSLTIPGIRYVFDCGRAKEKKFDRMTGVQSFDIGWISKASASQRAGRAGRTGPGHCYRLYSSAVYERDFEEHAEPEILRMPVEGVVLQLKSMDLQHVVNFPFPTPPDRHSLAKAEKLLTYLGAVSREGKITPVGRELSNYPLSPRFSKMLTIGHQHGCMPYTIALVASLASLDLFIPENQLGLSVHVPPEIYTNEDRLADDARTQRKSQHNHAHHLFSRHSPTSDALKGLTALCAYAYAPSREVFCKDMFLSPKALSEASNLCSQLMSIVRNNNPTLLAPSVSLKLPSPSKTQVAALQQFTAAAFIDQIAILASASLSPPDLPRKPTRAIDVPYLPLFPINTKRRADTDIIDIAVFIHPSSVLAHLATKDLPNFVIYSHLQRGTPATIEGAKKPRTRMHALTAVTAKQIAGLAKGTPLLVYGKPIGKIEEGDSKTRTCWVIPSLMGEKGNIGWPLPAQKVVQKKDGKGEWIVEKVIG
ncbi:MAG: putative ATP-dependent RNA helicase DHR1 [Alectoria sarmentosa]|nr:MAG: putative ATP-dependent RNA helicase DHR1 [Alectoria sarmentosa]